MTEELLFNGRKEILFLTNSSSYSAIHKLNGYKAALNAYGITTDRHLILHSENSIYTTRDMLLRQRNLHFDSVIAVEDRLAIGVLKYAHVRGLRIPGEINVIGYNNSELSISSEPELTSIDNRVEILCKTAIDSIMALLSGNKIRQKQLIKCHLVKRCTTDF